MDITDPQIAPNIYTDIMLMGVMQNPNLFTAT